MRCDTVVYGSRQRSRQTREPATSGIHLASREKSSRKASFQHSVFSETRMQPPVSLSEASLLKGFAVLFAFRLFSAGFGR
jgi:hypothetical protein